METKTDRTLDLIYGADRIAAFLGIGRRQVYNASARHGMPVFRIGTTICARESTLREWLAEREHASTDRRR